MLFFKNGDLSKSVYEEILTVKTFQSAFDFSDPERLLNLKTGNSVEDLKRIEEKRKQINTELNQSLEVNEPKTKIEEVRKKFAQKKEAVKNISQISSEKEVQSFMQEKVEEKDIIKVTSEAKTDSASGAKFFKTERLNQSLKKIKLLFEKNDFVSKTIILLLVFVLGLLHALEPGHGKSILISYLVDKNKTLKDAFKFNIYLTITHLLDVLLLGVAFKVFLLMSDVSKYIGIIQRYAIYSLLLISFFMLIKNLFFQKTSKETKHKGKILAIIAGLAPCTIGWGIMVALITLDKFAWIVPIILVFGLGLFTSMMVLSFVILNVKINLLAKNEHFLRYAPVLSSGLLFCIALFLLSGI